MISIEEIKRLDSEYIANTYSRFDVVFKKGKGSLLYDVCGKRYIDFGSGIAVSAFGVCDKIWSKAVTKQAKTLSHVSNLYYSLPQIELARILCARTGMKKVFFCNSGAEANEGAIKCARKYSLDKYGEGRNEIVTLVNSFHGRTMATLSATGQEVFHKNYAPFLDGFVFIGANDIATLDKAITPKTAAIMFELVQGEGGVNPLEQEFVNAIAKICREKDVLMIVDEVQTGNGRTGTLYAYEQFGIEPDILTTAKGMAGGLPMGAVLFADKTQKTFGYGDHATTFGGNPVAAAAAVSVIERIDDNLLAGVKQREKIIRETLNSIDGIKNISGMGLMLGIETVKDAKEIVNNALRRGLVLLTAKNKVRLLPALNIPLNILSEGLEILKESVKA